MARSFEINPQRSTDLDNTLSDKCPHCHVAFSARKIREYIGVDADGDWAFSGALCPACSRLIIFLEKGEMGWLRSGIGADKVTFHPKQPRLIHLIYVLPEPIPKDTPPKIAKDYREASMVLAFSPNASAALSRRCLQHIIHERSAQDIQNFKPGNLQDEIRQVVDNKAIQNDNLNKLLDKVRIVGNFAAHPNKSKYSGLIMDVEPNEAEFNLKVIGRLLFWYYTESLEEQKIIDDIDKKLQEKSR